MKPLCKESVVNKPRMLIDPQYAFEDDRMSGFEAPGRLLEIDAHFCNALTASDFDTNARLLCSSRDIEIQRRHWRNFHKTMRLSPV